jgi:hypothetical protein
MRNVEARHVVRRIGGPALAADIVIEAAITIGENIEAAEFLIAQIAGQRVFILLAETAADHCLKKMTRTEIFGVPARPRQRAGDRCRQLDVLGGPIHVCLPPRLWAAPYSRATARLI